MNRQDKSLVLVWVALLLLLAASAGSALLRLGAWNSVLNLAVAAVKAALVLLFFMRLRASHKLLRLAALSAFATLAVLFGLASSDYATRTVYPAPLQTPRQLAPHALPLQ